MFTTKICWETEFPKILELGKQGYTMAEIARKYGVSRQRIKQVCNKYCPNWADICGFVVRRKFLDERYKEKWGTKEDTDLYRAKRLKFNIKKANAKRNGHEFSIMFNDITWPDTCPVLGIPLDYFAEGKQENSVSFDCLDPKKDYVKGNVFIMSWRANRLKNDGTLEEFEKLTEYLRSHKA